MKKLIYIFLLLGFVHFVNAQSYLGYVSKSVNFRVSPSTNSDVITTLKVGTPLFVVSMEKIEGYYEVLNIETNKEGYVYAQYVDLDKLLPKNEQGIFTPTGKTNNNNPTIEIYNRTSITMSLRLNDVLYSFNPDEKKKLTLKEGGYSYRASAPGVIPDYGSENLKSNYNYSWEFYIASK